LFEHYEIHLKIRPESLRNFKAILKRAKLPTNIKLHILRHSFVTNLLESSENPLMWSLIWSTMPNRIFLRRTYGHVKAKVHAPAVKKYEAAILRKTTTKWKINYLFQKCL
jgi:hypothetical protein